MLLASYIPYEVHSLQGLGEMFPTCSIRETGGSPRLSDLAKFVKRQAAIRNDPGFVVERRFQRCDLTPKASGVHPERQTFNYATDMTALGVTDVLQRTPKLNLDQ